MTANFTDELYTVGSTAVTRYALGFSSGNHSGYQNLVDTEINANIYLKTHFQVSCSSVVAVECIGIDATPYLTTKCEWGD